MWKTDKMCKEEKNHNFSKTDSKFDNILKFLGTLVCERIFSCINSFSLKLIILFTNIFQSFPSLISKQNNYFYPENLENRRNLCKEKNS
jgi:hypothetical protein